MRNRLQYLYSIFILLGVLVSSYWMFEKRSIISPLGRTQAAKAMKVEASLAPSGLNQLLELESQFKVIDLKNQESSSPKHNRLPTQQSLLKQRK